MEGTYKTIKKVSILKINIDSVSYSSALKKIIARVDNHVNSYICVSNVHMCMEAFDDPFFCKVVNNADLVVPDGKPLVWAQRWLGEKTASQVRGPDLFLLVCKEAEKANIPIGLYGGTKQSLSKLMIFLEKKFPKLNIPYSYSPPFRQLTPIEDEICTKNINDSGTRIVFVGIGCPKQERWMAAHKDRLNCVMIGVGAAFDFFSGEKRQAPRWMQKAGMEWVFRLFNDPKRLWKRYLKHNPRFVYYFLKQLLGKTY